MKKILNNEIKTFNMKERIKRLSIIYCIFLSIVLIISLIYAFLIHKEILTQSDKAFNNTTFIIGIICFFILGLICGLSAKKNGFLDAFISSMIIILISLIINLFLKESYSFQTFIKNLVFVLSASLGGIIGINMKSKKEK